MARLASQSTTGFGGASAARFFASHGLTDPHSLEQIRARADYYPKLVPAVPASFCRLMDGNIIRIDGRDWHCISGYGRPGPAALAADRGRLMVTLLDVNVLIALLDTGHVGRTSVRQALVVGRTSIREAD